MPYPEISRVPTWVHQRVSPCAKVALRGVLSFWVKVLWTAFLPASLTSRTFLNSYLLLQFVSSNKKYFLVRHGFSDFLSSWVQISDPLTPQENRNKGLRGYFGQRLRGRVSSWRQEWLGQLGTSYPQSGSRARCWYSALSQHDAILIQSGLLPLVTRL